MAVADVDVEVRPRARRVARPASARRRRRLRAGLSMVLLGSLPVALISSFLVFAMSSLAGGDPATTKLGDNATPAAIARLNHEWGLDRSFIDQYASWLGHAVTGDLGTSYISGIPVATSVQERLPIDLSITLVALVTMIAVGFAGGILAALRSGGIADRVITLIASAAATIPEFWLAIMSVVLFSVTLGWLPSGGYVGFTEDPRQWLVHMVLPGVSLGLIHGAQVARQLRGSLITELASDYVVGARVRGLSPMRILMVHALRNAAAPAVSTIGLAIPMLLGGAVIAESIFGLPGLGQFVLDAAQTKDIPVVEGVLLVSVAIVLICNLVVEALLAWLRPATREA